MPEHRPEGYGRQDARNNTLEDVTAQSLGGRIPDVYTQPVLSIGENITRLREARGWTQEEFGERMRMRQSSVSKLEQGTNHGVRTLLKVAKVMECSIEDLVVGVDEEYDRLLPAPDESERARPVSGTDAQRAQPLSRPIQPDRMLPEPIQTLAYGTPDLASASASLQQSAADIVAVARQLLGGQAAVDREEGSDLPSHPRTHRRPPHRKRPKKPVTRPR